MINRIIEICFQKRYVVWVCALLLAFYGYVSSHQMKIEAYPELSDVTVLVTTQVPGLAAEEIEKQITIPLERALINTPKKILMRSSSTFALSLITLVFNGTAEDFVSRQLVINRLADAVLPPGVHPSLGPLTGSGGEIYRYTLQSDTKTLMELSEIQSWVIIPALKQVPGIIDVINFGGLTKQYELKLDALAMQRYSVAINEVMAAVSANTSNSGGGRATKGEQSYIVRGVGQIHDLNDFNQIVIKQNNGVPILVKDIGQVEFGYQEREGILGKNHNPDAVQGIVQMLKNENASHVLKALHEKIDELQNTLASMDVKIVPYIDRDNLVDLTIHKVSHTVIEGIALVCFVLIIFLGSPRAAVVVAAAIPCALISVFILMNLTQMPANLFSLGAIDFGVIVDGAIVVMEAILRFREEHPDKILTGDDILLTTAKVARPIFFATLIIMTAYFPLFAFERAEGKLFRPMAFTVSFALIGALICAMALVPGLAYSVMKKPRKIFHNKPLEWLTQQYQQVLSKCLDFPGLFYALGAGVLACVILLGASVGKEFLPELDEGALWLQVDMPSGLSLEKANEMAANLRQKLIAHPEISYAVTQLGRNDSGTDSWTPSHIEVPVGLTDYSTWPKRENKAKFVAKLHEEFNQMPGYAVGISQPIIDNVNDIISGSHSPLALRIYGDDLTKARAIATQIVRELKSIRGTASASIYQPPPIPQIKIDINREKIARYGINVDDINALIQTGFGGAPVAVVYNDNRYYNVTTRFPKEDKTNIERIGNLFVNASTGAKIPLSELATFSYTTGQANITHENTKRQLTIRIDNGGRDLTSYLAEAKKRVKNNVKFDEKDFKLEWSGQFESQARAQARLVDILLIMLITMSILLFFEFQKVRTVILILGVVPMATLGGLITLHLTRETLNVATAVGFIALFGVSIQNAIIMISNIKRLRETAVSVRDAVITGATERLRPVLMTATVASIGMLPAALATGVGTDVQRGLATVIVGGLFFSTLLTLFVLPTYYYALECFVERGGIKGWWSRHEKS